MAGTRSLNWDFFPLNLKIKMTRSQDYLVFEDHNTVNKEIGEMALKYYRPHEWNSLQIYFMLYRNKGFILKRELNGLSLFK